MNYSKVFTSLVLTLSILGCSTESRKKMDTVPGESTDFESEKGTNFRALNYETRLSSIKEFNTYGIPKKKVFNFKSCLVERLGKSALMPDIRFRVEDGRGLHFDTVTDNNGCINWHETFEYNHIAPETLVLLKRKVTALSTYTGATMVKMAFNPWMYGSLASSDIRNSYLDSVEPADPESLAQGKIKFLNQVAQPIEIAVDALNFEFKGMDFDNYEISKFLNLTVAHKYTLRIKPTVIRRALDNISVTQALVGGRLKAYLAIFKDTKGSKLDAKSLITVQEFDLDYAKSTGQFMADVSIKFPNISEMTSRTKALLTLVPADEIEGLSEMNYEGALKPAPLASLSLSQGQVSAKNIFMNQKAPMNLKPLDVLKSKDSGLVPMALNTPPSYNFMYSVGFTYLTFPDVLNEAFYGQMTEVKKKYLTQVLCQKLYPLGNKDTTAFNCQSNPGFYMKSEIRFLVEEVTSKPEPVGDTSVEDLEMKVSISQSQKNSYARGWKASIGAGLSGSIGYDFLHQTPDVSQSTTPKSNGPLSGSLAIKGNAGIDYNWIWEGKYAEEKSVGVTATSTTKITSEGNTFNFNVKARPCIFAVPAPGILPYLTKNKMTVPGVYACGDKIVNQTRQETWYLLTQSNGVKDSPYSDPLAKKAGPWRMMVRGRTPMLMFYNFLKDAKINLILERLPTDDAKSELDASLMQMQEFPGLLPLR